jgi:hypothetical protein
MLALLFGITGLVTVSIWAFLALARGGYWRFAQRDIDVLADPADWPEVVAVVPARNEADVIARSLGSVLGQDYPGDFRVILVDDHSDDGTAGFAHCLGSDRLTILTGTARPAGWAGKLWALDQGIFAAGAPEYLWLTDADIGHAPDHLRRLVARARAGNLATSEHHGAAALCAAGRTRADPGVRVFLCDARPVRQGERPRAAFGGGGRGLRSGSARRAGGGRRHCRDLRPAALPRFAAGGIAAISREIIDDCALARAIKPHGPIWLGIGDRATSLRPCDFAEIRRMVARSAYAPLGYSPLALPGTLGGLLLVCAAPVVLALLATGPAQSLGIIAWLQMAATMAPILHFYRVAPLWGLALPFIALVYAGFTLDSAVQHWRGRGGMRKGRAQAARSA